VRFLALVGGFLCLLTACGAESNREPGAVTTQSFAAFCADLARIERLGERGTGTAGDVRAFATGSLDAAESAIEHAPTSLRAELRKVVRFYRAFLEFARRLEFDPDRIAKAPDSERFSQATIDEAIIASGTIEAFAAKRCPRAYDIL
jgi:hypothetical protein